MGFMMRVCVRVCVCVGGQVVGPAHMGTLCSIVQAASSKGVVRHFLLGNNIAFSKVSWVLV